MVILCLLMQQPYHYLFIESGKKLKEILENVFFNIYILRFVAVRV